MATQEQNATTAERLPPGRHGLPRDAVAQSQRGRLLAAMTELVAKEGYRKATVGEVSKRARVSKATFYQHFANREECFWAANEEHFRAIAVAVDVGYKSGGETWPERIRSGLGALLEYLAAHEDFARVVFIEALAVGDSGLVRRQAVLAALRSYFDPRVRPEMAVEVERPELAASAVVDSLAGMLYERVLEGRTGELRDALDDFVYVAMLPYGQGGGG